MPPCPRFCPATASSKYNREGGALFHLPQQILQIQLHWAFRRRVQSASAPGRFARNTNCCCLLSVQEAGSVPVMGRRPCSAEEGPQTAGGIQQGNNLDVSDAPLESFSVDQTLRSGRPAARRANSVAFEQLYRSYWKDLCQQVRRAFGSGPPEPEDVAQAAFARFAELADPEQVRNPRALLLVTARNIVLDHKRRNGRHNAYARTVQAELISAPQSDFSPERVLIDMERLEIVKSAIDKLPHKQKVVLSLHRHRGYTYQQIVAETGWSYGDVYRQMEAALATLASALKR